MKPSPLPQVDVFLFFTILLLIYSFFSSVTASQLTNPSPDKSPVYLCKTIQLDIDTVITPVLNGTAKSKWLKNNVCIFKLQRASNSNPMLWTNKVSSKSSLNTTPLFEFVIMSVDFCAVYVDTAHPFEEYEGCLQLFNKNLNQNNINLVNVDILERGEVISSTRAEFYMKRMDIMALQYVITLINIPSVGDFFRNHEGSIFYRFKDKIREVDLDLVGDVTPELGLETFEGMNSLQELRITRRCSGKRSRESSIASQYVKPGNIIDPSNQPKRTVAEGNVSVSLTSSQIHTVEISMPCTRLNSLYVRGRSVAILKVSVINLSRLLLRQYEDVVRLGRDGSEGEEASYGTSGLEKTLQSGTSSGSPQKVNLQWNSFSDMVLGMDFLPRDFFMFGGNDSNVSFYATYRPNSNQSRGDIPVDYENYKIAPQWTFDTAVGIGLLSLDSFVIGDKTIEALRLVPSGTEKGIISGGSRGELYSTSTIFLNAMWNVTDGLSLENLKLAAVQIEFAGVVVSPDLQPSGPGRNSSSTGDVWLDLSAIVSNSHTTNVHLSCPKQLTYLIASGAARAGTTIPRDLPSVRSYSDWKFAVTNDRMQLLVGNLSSAEELVVDWCGLAHVESLYSLPIAKVRVLKLNHMASPVPRSLLQYILPCGAFNKTSLATPSANEDCCSRIDKYSIGFFSLTGVKALENHTLTRDMLCHFTRLGYLNMSGNALRSIETGAFSTGMLVYENAVVDLARNRLESVPSVLFGESNTLRGVELYLETNLLTRLPDAFIANANFALLDVSHNHLTTFDFPRSFVNCTLGYDSTVSVSWNNLSSVDMPDIASVMGDSGLYAETPSLKLNFSHNALTSFSLKNDSFGSVPTPPFRINVDISANKIASFRKTSFRQLYYMSHLNLSWNLLNSPNDVNNIHFLRDSCLYWSCAVDVSWNSLNNTRIMFSSWFKNTSIHRLDLSGNGLQTVPTDIGNIEMISSVYVGKSYFTVTMKHNPIKTVDKSLCGASDSSVFYYDLSHCQIEYVSSPSFICNLTQNANIMVNLNSNPLQCLPGIFSSDQPASVTLLSLGNTNVTILPCRFGENYPFLKSLYLNGFTPRTQIQTANLIDCCAIQALGSFVLKSQAAINPDELHDPPIAGPDNSPQVLWRHLPIPKCHLL